MATLAADKRRSYVLGDRTHYPVIAGDVIYEGAVVGEDDNGNSRPLQAGDAFQGFAVSKADNADGAAGAVNVEVRVCGVVEVPIAGITLAANDKPAVYASDDDTFTLTAGANSLIGYVSRFVSPGVAEVHFDANLVKAALQA